MKSPYSGKVVNGKLHDIAWYCDFCGGYFDIRDLGYMDDEIQICEECYNQRKVLDAPNTDR
jgi:hypothetical protein